MARNFIPRDNARVRLVQANSSDPAWATNPKRLGYLERIFYLAEQTQRAFKDAPKQVREAIVETHKLMLHEKSRKQWKEPLSLGRELIVKKLSSGYGEILLKQKNKIEKLGSIILKH